MAKINIKDLNDSQKARLIESKWTSSATLWDIVENVYKQNTAIYANEADWISSLPQKRRKGLVQANRIFVNMEAVINSIIANPPGINILPARDGDEAAEFARKLESYFRKKYLDLNIKETMRMGYRNLYFSRLFVIKAFWNTKINDFDYRVVDPRKVRFSKFARKETDSEFAIEEIEDNLCAIVERFPEKKAEIMHKFGFTDEQEMYIRNPDVKYKEAWVDNETVIFKLDNLILGEIKNPYWDWDGVLITDEEEQQLTGDKAVDGEARRQLLNTVKMEQDTRKNPEYGQVDLKTYYFNYFDTPRKPYIFATILNNENSPVGRTDFITLSASLQMGIDKRKLDIDENCELSNGIVMVDSSVMDKSDAQRIRWETRGVIWGKGVKDGVIRQTGANLPQMVFDDMLDSRSEIDNIMAASSAFRGEREGQETKAGRLALIQQSFLRLNELIQMGDFVAKEVFDWGMQLAKTRYTEYHYAKWMGKEGAREVIEIIQDDFETGTEVKIIPGKTIPVDDEFRFEQAQNDFKQGALSLTDYLEASNYDDAKEKAKNAVVWALNKPISVGMTPEEMQQVAPVQKEEKPPNVSISYADLPADAQIQLLEQIGIQADPEIMFGEKLAQKQQSEKEFQMKNQPKEVE